MPSFVITGARTGIGLEYVRQLALHPGNTIIALVRNATSDMASLDRIMSEAQARVNLVECDLSSSESITSLPARLPQDLRLDIVIQNAAILLSGSYEESTLNVTPESLRAHFETNVVGPAFLFQTLAPFLKHGAMVANITSGVGSMTMLSRGQITAQIPAYSLSKAALNMLTVHQAEQLKGKTIVVCVDPGHAKTQMGGPGAVMEVEDSARRMSWQPWGGSDRRIMASSCSITEQNSHGRWNPKTQLEPHYSLMKVVATPKTGAQNIDTGRG